MISHFFWLLKVKKKQQKSADSFIKFSFSFLLLFRMNEFSIDDDTKTIEGERHLVLLPLENDIVLLLLTHKMPKRSMDVAIMSSIFVGWFQMWHSRITTLLNKRLKICSYTHTCRELKRAPIHYTHNSHNFGKLQKKKEVLRQNNYLFALLFIELLKKEKNTKITS